MRPLLPGLLLATALLSTPVWAAQAAEVARVQARQARVHVNEIRARQLSLRGELNRLAQQIEAQKAKQQGALLTGSALDASLQRSQELSGSLTQTAQELSRAEAELEKDNLALLSAVSRELKDARAQWDATADRTLRAQLIRKMRALRDEREQVRAMLPASRVPALQTAGSDDPEDLLEQADTLRDSEDKVRQRMKALRARIGELREERELDRRMDDFLGDESMFDDADRRLRRTRAYELAQQGQPPLSAGAQADSSEPPLGSAPSSPEGSSSQLPGPTGDKSANLGPQQPPSVNVTQIVKSADSRPQIGSPSALLLENDGSGDLSSLEAQLQKLEGLAQQLDRRADEMERQARALE